MITSLTLTILAQRGASGSSVIDALGADVPAVEGEAPAVDPNAILVPDLGALTVPLSTTEEPAAE